MAGIGYFDVRRCVTVPELLRRQAERRGGELLYRFLATGDPDGAAEEWTFADLERRARAVGALLQEAGVAGERALLVYPPGLEFIEGFMGCLCAGVVAVPSYPPDPTRLERTLPRLRAIARDAGARIVLTTTPILAMAQAILPAAPELAALRWLATDVSSPELAAVFRPPDVPTDALAFLQYTSGSTGDPRGVMVTHANVLHNEWVIARSFRHDESSRGVGWLPLFHDMGLIGNVLQPLYTGFPCTLMSPLAFLQQPLRWLKAISRFQATTSGGPNFAYELCVRKVPPADRAQLDLSSWKVAFNGAEPIRKATLDRFCEAFAPSGFRRESIYPCYGLAESTLIVSGAAEERAPVTRVFAATALTEGRAEDHESVGPARALVSSGPAGPEQRLVVVSPDAGVVLPPERVGEIWVSSPSVARGYWGRPEETALAFGARLPDGDGPFLRTGDLGFTLDGELFVTGRLKDLIVIRGRNHFPQDLEQTAEAAHPAVRAGCVAAFALEDVEGVERLGIAAEIDTVRAGGDLGAVGQAIQRAIAEEHGLSVRTLALLPSQAIPKTSSGKIQRSAARKALAAGALPLLANLEDTAEPVDGVSIEDNASMVRDALAAAPLAERGTLLLALLRRELARELRQDPDQIDATCAPAGLGLDSLGMLAVEGRLETALGVALRSAFLWRHETLAAAVEELAGAWATRGAGAVAITPVGGESTRPPAVSSGQARLWFLDRLLPDSAAYNVHAGLLLRGPLDVTALERSLSALVERHAVLRTTFVAAEDGAPHAQMAPPTPVALPLVELREHPLQARTEALRDLFRAESALPFDLAVGPLWRVTLARIADEEHALLLVLHHAVTDGWSMGILVRELMALYRQARRGESPALPPAPRYDDYVHSTRARGGADEDREFWRARLAGLPRLDLPIARPRPGPLSLQGATLRFTLAAELVESTRRFARERGVTLFTVMLGAFAALLHRYSGQDDIGIGTVVASRGRPEHQDLVGFLANTLVLRLDLGQDPSFLEILERSRRVVGEALVHSELPFDDVVRVCRAGTAVDHNPLFQAAFLMESLPAVDLDVPGMSWVPTLDVPDGSVEDTAKFDLALMMANSPEGASMACQYSVDRFDESSIQRLISHFEVLLLGLVSDPARPVSMLRLLTEEERRRILQEWNATGADFSREACVHGLFEAQVRRTPNATAVSFEGVALSYAELDARANRLAARLAAFSVGPETRVGLYVERSLELVVGLLGILKTGAAYVPLDPAYPAERTVFVVLDAGVVALVTQEHLASDLPAQGCPVLCVDQLEQLDAGAGRSVDVAPESLAYVIYTSGSTGRPKGVMVPHRSVVNFFESMDRRLGAEPPGVFLALTSVAFDISVLELLWTLTRGFRVVVHPEQRTAALRTGSQSPPMDFSLFYFADDEERGGSDRYRLLLEGARFADQNGFAAVWTPERHFHAFGGLYPNPSVTGAAVAAATRRVGIRAGSVVLPLHHPVRVAEEWSLVDNLSGGRVGVSFASGWHADDFALAPQHYANRRELMLENLDLVRRFWRGEAVRLTNGAGQPVDVRLRPRPVQRELPVWLTAAGNPETFRVAGEIGANVLTHLLGQNLKELREKIALYREARRRAGHTGPGHVTLMLHTFVEQDMNRVRAKAAEPFRSYLKSSADLMRGFGKSVGIDVDDASFTEADLDALVGLAHERLFATSGLFGTPRSCEEMIGRIEEIGVDEVACLVDFGVDTDAVLASLPYLDALRRRAQRRLPAPPLSVPAQIVAHGATHLQCTPSLAQALLLDPDAESALSSLRALLVGGEALPAPLAARLHASAPGRVINMYGPTETTIWSATHRVAPEERGAVVSIGKPIENTGLYVLNLRLQPVPVGITGELYISGAGLARGYHARPGLTAERFVPNPFAEPGERMYRTGDLARFREDGSIEFLGRADQQIKLRGFRVELGEIEAVLSEHPGIREAAAAVREERPGDQRLVAYVVPRGAAAPDGEDLRRFVRQRLPEHMIPSVIVPLQAMPMTPNGKLDRRALPAPEVDLGRRRQAFTAARNDVERQIADIWAGVLGVAEVGIHDNFFDLGGHSLLLAQVHARVRAGLRADLPLVKLIEHPTVGALARYLSEEPQGTAVAISQAAQGRARQQVEALRRQRAREPKR